jgi:hypothetical protein
MCLFELEIVQYLIRGDMIAVQQLLIFIAHGNVLPDGHIIAKTILAKVAVRIMMIVHSERHVIFLEHVQLQRDGGLGKRWAKTI